MFKVTGQKIWFSPLRTVSPAGVRRQENPALSPRIGPVPSRPPVRFPGRNWYSYYGYPRPFSRPAAVPLIPLLPPSPARWRILLPRIVFALLPGLLYPLFFFWGARLYPRLPLAGRLLRPPTAPTFFPEMLVVILGIASVIAIQTVFALIFLHPEKGRRNGGVHFWGEASVAGGLLAAGIYGVLRGFQYRTDDLFFLPPLALAAAIFCWVMITGTELFGPRKRKEPYTPGPIRTADTRFRKPVLYPSELQGRGIFA